MCEFNDDYIPSVGASYDVRVRRPDDEQPASPGTPCVWVSLTRETVIHQLAVVPASQHHGVSPHGSVLHHTGACSIYHGPPPTVVFTHVTIKIVDLY